jgi:hypothetical protein
MLMDFSKINIKDDTVGGVSSFERERNENA